MAKLEKASQQIQQWLERDLSATIADGELPRGFECDEVLNQITETIRSGKSPVLTGESGIGKSTAIYELLHRVHESENSAENPANAESSPLENLRGKRCLQFSIRRRLASLNRPVQLRKDFQKLLKALLAIEEAGTETPIVPFFRDLHLAYDLDLESQLHSFAYKYKHPILAEGKQAIVERMFDDTPELEQHFLQLKLKEPKRETVVRILNEWNEKVHFHRFQEESLDEALDLSDRFLTRTRLPRKTLDLLSQVATLTPDDCSIHAAEIIDRFCRNHQVPRFLVDPAIPLKLTEVDQHFSEEVLGQPRAVSAIVRMVSLIKAGLSDVRRPFGAFLFAGPSGVGKTHLAQELAHYLFGSRERLVRFNMADYQYGGADSVLFGIPGHYKPAMERGVLTERLQNHPFAVLLLDEFEKSHPNVLDRFLQFMDEGCFINGAGDTVSCRSLIIIATSNAGSEIYREEPFGFNTEETLDKLEQRVDLELRKHFRFEFLNRFDEIVHFLPLASEEICKIADRELKKLEDRSGLRRRNITLNVSECVLKWLSQHGYDVDFGARFLRRTIERNVSTAIAGELVNTALQSAGEIRLFVEQNTIKARFTRPESESDSAAPQNGSAPQSTTSERLPETTSATALV